MLNRRLFVRCAIGALALVGSAAQLPAAVLTSGGYTQNFDALGATGTSLASAPDWSVLVYSFGTNATWGTSIPASGANSISSATTPASASLVAASAFPASPSSSSTQGYNLGSSAGATDRALGVSPTSIAGLALDLSLTNSTGGPLSSLVLSYDIRRFTAVATANDLPGYWVFYSLDNGATWTNVAALNPTLSGPTGVIVPNSVGVTAIVNETITLASMLADGANVRLRWVDDNAAQTSPDQIIGLDNVVVGVPSPGASALFALGAIVGARRRRLR